MIVCRFFLEENLQIFPLEIFEAWPTRFRYFVEKSCMVAHTDAQCVCTHCASVCATMRDFERELRRKQDSSSIRVLLPCQSLLLLPISTQESHQKETEKMVVHYRYSRKSSKKRRKRGGSLVVDSKSPLRLSHTTLGLQTPTLPPPLRLSQTHQRW